MTSFGVWLSIFALFLGYVGGSLFFDWRNRTPTVTVEMIINQEKNYSGDGPWTIECMIGGKPATVFSRYGHTWSYLDGKSVDHRIWGILSNRLNQSKAGL